MKTIFILIILFFSFSCKSQTLAIYKRQMDSLSKLTGLAVIGYTKTIVRDRESFVVFYEKNGEMEEKILYTRKVTASIPAKIQFSEL